jgi:seryl-tRNA synthetase
MTQATLVERHAAMRDRFFGAGLLIPSGVDGVYGRSAEFEHVVSGLKRAVHVFAAVDGAENFEFPPIIPRATFERIGYLRNFPQLAGPVFSFQGGERDFQALLKTLDDEQPYGEHLSQTEVVLVPACCYPVYPMLTGTMAIDHKVVQTSQYCFRHEPSVDPMRLQAFRQMENVSIGMPDHVHEWRSRWLERAPQLLCDLGLEVRSDVANDPFFGRAGRLMSASQRELQLKIELLVPVFGDEDPTACASINYHEDHFGELFGIRTPDGERAHSSCIGFGLERCTVALFAAHGMSISAWPAAVRQRLWE